MLKMGIRSKIRTAFWTYKAKKIVAEFGQGSGVHHCSKLTKNTYVKNDCHFNGMEITGNGKVTIGSHFHSGKDCSIITHVHNYEGDTLPYDKKVFHKDVSIGKNVWIGDHVIILGGSIIEDGAIIQAGSVVCGKVPYCAIAGGHPAKPYKYRNIDHYETLAKDQDN